MQVGKKECYHFLQPLIKHEVFIIPQPCKQNVSLSKCFEQSSHRLAQKDPKDIKLIQFNRRSLKIRPNYPLNPSHDRTGQNTNTNYATIANFSQKNTLPTILRATMYK
jgi:hypothetical protein